jgi:hypothetical protein
MGIKILRLRHRSAPAMNGCRWCGADERGHGQMWVPGKKWHTHTEPTDAQRLARKRAAWLPAVPTIVTNITANDARTRL